MGYQSAPLVEDLGTFSARGGIIDVFCPLYGRPVRIELFGDTVESLRAVRPGDTAHGRAPEGGDAHPRARGALHRRDAARAAEAAARAAAERIDIPTPAARALDRSARASPASGWRRCSRDSSRAGSPRSSTTWRTGRGEPARLHGRSARGDSRRGGAAAEIEQVLGRAEPRQGPGAPAAGSTSPRTGSAAARPRAVPVLEGGGLSLSASGAPVAFTLGTTRDCAQAILIHHGEEGALTRWCSGSSAGARCAWRARSSRAARRAGGPREAAAAGPERHGAGCTASRFVDSPALQDPSICAHLFTGEVSHGFVDTAGGLAVLSDEEIFGARARRRVQARRWISRSARLRGPQGRRPHRPHRLRDRPLYTSPTHLRKCARSCSKAKATMPVPTPRIPTNTAPKTSSGCRKEARWSHPQGSAKQPTIGKLVDDAMVAIERDNPTLKGVLPKDYARPGLDKQRLGELIDLIGNIGLGDAANRSKDILGRVYEYFLAQFASAEGKKGGQFYTPALRRAAAGRDARALQGPRLRPVLRLGRHVRAVARSSSRRTAAASATSRIYGQESNHTTWRLAKMNLAIRGIDAQHRPTATPSTRPPPGPEGRLRPGQPAVQRQRLGRRAAARRRALAVRHAARRATPTSPGCSTSSTTWRPPASPASCWPTASCRRNQSGEGDIRKAIIEADLVDCMVALPGQLFYSTQIPVCLWFLAKNKQTSKRP